MELAMQVDMWADVVCSWCGIANRRVKQAIAAFEHADQVTLVHHSFRLLDSAEEGTSLSFGEYFATLGMTQAQMRQAAGQVERVAASDGIDEYHVSDNTIGNTTLAHEFLAFASEHGDHNAAWDLMLESHFAVRAPLWSIADLTAFAAPLGLDPVAARTALEARTYRDRVVAEHQQLVSFGANGVPFLVIDNKYAVAGAQPVSVITAALERAWNEGVQA